ncbi:NEDD8 ultimate buster 1-like isoform X1 [Porites lutea]|uniref:NEDD8 ultimate buster 1-like isoform X1 n=1 Tax=Porites lutea TaxID=51062 RepID=UPI003CC51DD6
MAEESPHFNGLLNRVREKLRSENVKLWLAPYTTSNDEPGKYPEEMINRYSAALEALPEEIKDALEELRVHALTKLQTGQRFAKSGIATIKVHLTGRIPLGLDSRLQIQIGLHVSGANFKKRLNAVSGLDPDKMKLICKGHVIDDDKSLESQNVKNNGQIMVLILSQSIAESELQQKKEEETKASVSRTRQAAEALSSRKDNVRDDRFFLEINDQEGKPIQLPDHERKALTLALTLHEKGRSELKKRNYAEALLLLLEAEKEFSHCKAQILAAVDNYGILCLDIVWCYFWLKSIVDLPNAEEKLQKCKECFQRSYGQNLERLTFVRGGRGGELALFVRLHILEAVCAYHKGDITTAVTCLDKAERMQGKLHIDKHQLTQLMLMGFTETEARLALRACHGDSTLAVDYITQRRQEKKEREDKEKKDRKRKKLERELGKTATGDWVNVDTYKALVEMGFSEVRASSALRQANNDVNNALQVLQDHPEMLDIQDNNRLAASSFDDVQFPDEHVAQAVSMGFEVDSVKEALRRCQGDISKAINMLASNCGKLPPISHSRKDESPKSGSEEDEEDPDITEAVNELVPDLATEDEEAYLNLSLEEETSIIAEYRTLLLSAGHNASSNVVTS